MLQWLVRYVNRVLLVILFSLGTQYFRAFTKVNVFMTDQYCGLFNAKVIFVER